jgi:DNA polymerase I-like protein with 3'-5' exonuclease and polymerase domains
MPKVTILEDMSEDAQAKAFAFCDMVLANSSRMVACDTETMGKQWYQIDQKIRASTDAQEIKKLKKEQAACSKEALSPRTNYLACLQIGASNYDALVIVTKGDGEALAKTVMRKLMGNGLTWVLHNAKFDLTQFLHHWELSFLDEHVHDTMVCESLIIGNRAAMSVSLKDTMPRYRIDEEFVKNDIGAAVSNWWDGLTKEQIAYASKDVMALCDLAKQQKEIMANNQQLRLRQLECRLVAPLTHIEQVGLHFDEAKLKRFLCEGKMVAAKFKEQAFEVFDGCNLLSSQQVLAKIQSHYGVTPVTRKFDAKTGTFVDEPSSDKWALLAAGIHREPAIAALLHYKELMGQFKLAETWLAANPLHISFFQVPMRDDAGDAGGARSGRMSASPRLQNVPNFMKQFVVAPDGWCILSSDYAGIELRIIAALSGDERMLKAFREDISLHKMTCEWALNVPYAEVNKKAPYYTVSKNINFGLPYGMKPNKLRFQILKGTNGDVHITEDEAKAYHELYYVNHPSIGPWQTRMFWDACTKGYTETRAGRRRYYNEADRPVMNKMYGRLSDPQGGFVDENFNPMASYRAADWRWRNIAYNTPVQGTGADGLKQALGMLVRELDPSRAKVFGTVHDSIDTLVRLDSVDYALDVQHQCMVDGMTMFVPEVPIEVEHTVGRCWASPPVDIKTDNYGLWQEDDLQKLILPTSMRQPV